MAKKKQEKPKKKTGKQSKKNIERQQEKILKVIVGVMIFLIIFAFVAAWFVKSRYEFEYEGFEFTKVMQGKEHYYATYIKTSTKTSGMAFMNNPKDLEDIPINATLIIKTNKLMYVSLDPNMTDCEEDGAALFNLGMFFSAIGVDVKSAWTDILFASNSSMPFKQCYNIKDDEAVIIVKEADETKITQEGEFCYTLHVAPCDLRRATERLMIGIMTHSQGNYIQ